MGVLWIICGASKHERAHWWFSINDKRISHFQFSKTEAEHTTEPENFAVDDCMPAAIWTIYWLGAQGYIYFENIVYQDKKSAILLENNGKG